MLLTFDYTPQKDKRYSCVDCMHLRIDTENKTYCFYEDVEPGVGIKLARKIDLTTLLDKFRTDGYREESK